MFCGKCGAKNDDNAKFCSGCGESLQSSPEKKPAREMNHRLIGIVAVLLAVAILLTVGMRLFGGRRSAEKTAEEVMLALEALDLTLLYELYPEPIQAWLVESNANTSTEEEYMEFLREKNEELISDMLGMESLIEWSNSGLSDIPVVDAYNELYKHRDMHISAAKALPIQLTVSVWGMEQTDEVVVVLIKYKGSWYVDYYSTENIF